MKRWLAILLIAGASVALVAAQTKPVDAPATQPAARFGYVDVFVDSRNEPLGAYQFEFTAESGKVTVVGIEGGESPAFKTPPYYDPAAMGQNRVILAAFSTDPNLPRGRSRIARIHVMIETASPQFVAKLDVAADAQGKTIAGANISVSEGARP